MSRKGNVRGIPLGVLGLAALLQLQEAGTNVSAELKKLGHADKIRFTPVPEPSAGQQQLSALTHTPQVTPQVRRGKYNVSAPEERTAFGITFDSKIEMNAYKLLQTHNIDFTYHPVYELQPKFELDGVKHRAVAYEGDFLLKRSDGTTILVDVKGVLTDMFKLKQKILAYQQKIPIYCVKTLDKLMLLLAEQGFLGHQTICKTNSATSEP